MVEPLVFVAIGLLVGTLGTLIGAGGGFILVPLFVLMYPEWPPEAITSISLAVVFFNAGSGSYAYSKLRKIDYRSALLFGAATLPGAVGGALATGYLQAGIFNRILAVLLVLISVYLIVFPNKAKFSVHTDMKGDTERMIVDREHKVYRYRFYKWRGILISFAVGFLSSLLGIGGGIIHVPALTGLLNFPVHIATATSHLMLAAMALTGTIVHFVTGTFRGNEIKIALLLGAGAVVGAQLGAYLSHKVKSAFIIRALAIALFSVGIRLFF